MQRLLIFAVLVLELAVTVVANDTRIAQAARKGDIAAVRALIAQRVDVNSTEADGSTALLWAAYRSDAETARALIAAGANVKAANRLGVTPLLEAARVGNAAAIIEMLLKAGADPNESHYEGETPLMAAAASGNVDAVKLLLAHGAQVNTKEQAEDQTALMWAAERGHAAVVRALIAAGADANLVAKPNVLKNYRGDAGRMWTNHSSRGLTALMFAARQGHLEAARALAEAGGDFNHANPDGITALMLAVINDRLDLAAMLVEKGANVNEGSLYEVVQLHNLRTNETVSEATRPRPAHENALTPLDLAARMLDRGAGPNRTATHTLNLDGTGVPDPANETPFLRALRSQDVGMLRLMAARGADVNAMTAAGQTSLMLAMGAGGARFSGGFGVAPAAYRFEGERAPIEAVKLLIDCGADVNATTPAGDTALHTAAQTGNVAVIKLLAAHGAKLDVRNKAGFTPLDTAMGKRAPGASGGRGGGGQGGPQEEAIALLRQLMGVQRE